MTITWDGSGAHPQKFSGPFTEVSVAADQAAVFIDGGEVLGTLRGGTHPIAAQTAPFLGSLSPSAELYMVRTSPTWTRFGSAPGVRLETGPMLGTLEHFGEWSYQVISPETFARASIEGDTLTAAGQCIAGLFDACALEWITGGYMEMSDLAAEHEKFRQVLPPHIETAIAKWGLRLGELGEFQATVAPD